MNGLAQMAYVEFACPHKNYNSKWMCWEGVYFINETAEFILAGGKTLRNSTQRIPYMESFLANQVLQPLKLILHLEHTLI